MGMGMGMHGISTICLFGVLASHCVCPGEAKSGFKWLVQNNHMPQANTFLRFSRLAEEKAKQT